MAYDDGFYYGQCKIICTTDNVGDNGKTVLVTTNDGKTFSATLSNLRCEFMLAGRTLYKVQLVANDVTEYTTEVEAGYGDCILVHLSNGYNEVMQKDLLDLDTIKNTANLQYKGASAQALKDVATSTVNEVFVNNSGKLVVRKNGADSVLNFSSIIDLSDKADQNSGNKYTYNVKNYYAHYQSLTNANFYVGYKSVPSASASVHGHAGESGGFWGANASYSIDTPSISYDASTGVLVVNVGASIHNEGNYSYPTFAKDNVLVILKY